MGRETIKSLREKITIDLCLINNEMDCLRKGHLWKLESCQYVPQAFCLTPPSLFISKRCPRCGITKSESVSLGFWSFFVKHRLRKILGI